MEGRGAVFWGGNDAVFQNVSLHFGGFFQNGKERRRGILGNGLGLLLGEQCLGSSRRRTVGGEQNGIVTMIKRDVFAAGLAVWGAMAAIAESAASESGWKPSPHAFSWSDGERVAFLGDALLEREQWHGHLETRLTARFPGKKIRFRNFAWSGDTPAGRSRASFDWHKEEAEWLERILRPLAVFRPTVVVLGYGMASSFDGEEALGKFRADLRRLIDRIHESLPESPPRFVLVGPIRHERLGGDWPNPEAHNATLFQYSAAAQVIAENRGFPFVDLFHWLGDGGESRFQRQHTENGIHLDDYGYWRLAEVFGVVMRAEAQDWKVEFGSHGLDRLSGCQVEGLSISGEKIAFTVRDAGLPFPNRDAAGRLYPTTTEPRRIRFLGLTAGRYLLKIDGRPIAVSDAGGWRQEMPLTRGPMFDQAELLRERIVKKNELFFHRFRPQNQTYLFGFRRHEQGNNAAEIPELDPLVANLEEQIFELARPRAHLYELVRLEAGEIVPNLASAGQDNRQKPKSLPAETPVARQTLPEFELAEGLEISLYAQNPLLHKPIQMNFDARGRLWVASSSVYPQIRPGQRAEDTVVVLEDRDRDGLAETSTVFAEGLLIPTGVEPGDGGVYVGQSTELLHFKDTNGDGKADQRKVVLSGFGTEDTHHMLHTLRWGHDGRLYMNQSIYIHSHVETPYGVKRLNSGGVWRLRPKTLELDVFLKGFCNPWGHHFDAYGQSFVTDGAGSQGISYGLPGAMYFTYAGAPRVLGSASPGSYPKFCGLELLYSDHFPKDWQGTAITCDFRAHRIVQFALEEQGAGYAAQELPELVRGRGNTFRPVDVKTGPDGALYIADWANPIIQHGEVDFRDPRRDKVHGRIWRLAYQERPLAKQRNLTKNSHRELLHLLLSPNGWEKQQVRRTLTERGSAILDALAEWVKEQESEFALLQGLWMHQSIDEVEPGLLARLLAAKDGRVRAAAVRVLGFWREKVDESFSLLTERVNDEHPRVRLEAVRALAQHPTADAAAAVLEGLNHPVDRFLNYALWLSVNELAEPWVNAIQAGQWSPQGREKQLEFGLQAIAPTQASEVLGKLLSEQSWKWDGAGPWIELIGKAGSAADLAKLLRRLAQGNLDAEVGLRAVQALSEAKRLRNIMPDSGKAGIARLFDAADPSLQAGALRLAGWWKLHEFEARFQEKAGDSRASTAAREAAIDALQSLGSSSAYQRLGDLLTQLDSVSIRPRIARALASLNLQDSIDSILNVMNEPGREADLRTIWQTILQQKEAEPLLIQALRGKTLSPSAATTGMRAVRESGRSRTSLLLALEKAGNLASFESPANRERIGALAQQAMIEGNPDRGEAIYRRPELGCVLCHSIGGVGGKVGPDLTSIGASAPVDYLVESLLAPNEKIKEGYHSLIVETTDGEEYSGILLRETPSELTLLDAANQIASIPKQKIANRTTGGSLMPAGLIEGLDASEQMDLFCFLAQLGKPGRFDASQNNVARQWRLRVGRHTDEQFGLEKIIANPASKQWQPVITLVDGRLMQDAMRQSLQLRNLDQTKNWIALFAAASLQIARKSEVTLQFSAPEDTRLWIDGKPMPFANRKKIELNAGRHDLVLQLNPRTLPEFIRAECDQAVFLAD